ncbi:MAG: UDP-N-acetylmuramoyl-L-alanyl-D-glutamate--2,6-diaminopimelate ligase [Desulfovibrionaceae bacterium]|nr:UDP-N-acetylmuramoyl-L-alanyl-D-glutamate--2,6-diaminopimelate ligase [Desulfovibrionaceae bacterium]
MASCIAMESLCEMMRKQNIDLHTDSRDVTPGSIFVALPSASDTQPGGEIFIQDAVRAGAAFVVCQPDIIESCSLGAGDDSVRFVPSVSPREDLGILSQSRYGIPDFPIYGVTGTNGKTTVTYLLEYLFQACGRKTGVLGTIAYRWAGHCEEAPLTTPGCLKLHEMLSQMQASGTEAAFMEVSSHALDQNRLAGIALAGGIFTNLTQDHLDYHHTMDAYFSAKSRLFLEENGRPISDRLAVIGTDDRWGIRLASLIPGSVGFGLHPSEITSRFLQVEMLRCSPDGLDLRFRGLADIPCLHTPQIGWHNAENMAAAAALALSVGLQPADLSCLEGFLGVPGRLERIDNPYGKHIFVDFAHTPDALEHVLKTLRMVGFTQIVTVFGCGGDRDRTKRPLMGEAVARYSDVVVVTSDNPRTEDPERIMDDIMPSLSAAGKVIRKADRREATSVALDSLKPGGVLLVAGKGHEKTQKIGGHVYPYSDQNVIRELLGCSSR